MTDSHKGFEVIILLLHRSFFYLYRTAKTSEPVSVKQFRLVNMCFPSRAVHGHQHSREELDKEYEDEIKPEGYFPMQEMRIIDNQ